MLAEAINKLESMAVRATTKLVEVSDPVKHSKRVFPPFGEAYDIADPLPAEDWQVSHLDSLVNLLSQRLIAGGNVTVMCQDNGLSMVGGEYHTWYPGLCFASFFTRAWRYAHTTPVKLTQREFVDWCREKMDGTGLESLVHAIRQVEFSRAESAKGLVERGRDTLGRSVEAAVSNVDTFPGKVKAALAMLVPGTGLSFPFDVTLNIEPIVTEQKFSIWFDADERLNAELATRRAIITLLHNRVVERIGDLEEKSKGIATFLY